MNRKHPDSKCEDCSLYDERPYVPSLLRDEPVKVFVLAEAPGPQEVTQQENLVGATGKLLFSALGQVGITREDCALVNAAMCYPPKRGKTSAPKDEEIAACSDDRLLPMVKSQDPQLILALGNSAMIGLFGSKGEGIMKERGKVREWNGYKVLPTVHPASMLHGGSAFPDFAADIEAIPGLLRGEVHEVVEPEVIVIENMKQLKQLIDLIREAAPCEVACDLETTGLNYLTDSIICMSLSVTGKRAFVVVQKLCTPAYLTALFKLPGVTWTYHNAKFDTQFLHTLLGFIVGHDDDTMLKSYALDERQGVHGLKHQASERLHAPNYEAEMREYLPTKKSSYALVPKPVLHKYAGYDAGYTRLLSADQDLRLDSEQTKFYERVLMPASRFLNAMEREGMLVNMDTLKKLTKTYGESLLEQEQGLFDVAGKVFNPRSPQQVSMLLYDDLHLPRPRRSKSAAATDKDDLEFNQHRHAIIPLMQQYRTDHKNYSTYIVGLGAQVWFDGRVHASYLIHGAVSRTSCRDPNIQNIPREGPIKVVFYAPDGWEIVWCDFSQHEYHMVAIYSEDEWLREVFMSGRNLHKEMAIEVYGPDYNSEQYVDTKMVNFGLLFGREAYSLSQQMGNTPTQAQEIIDAFFGRMPRVKPWQQEIVAAVFKGEDMISKLGRYRRFGLITQQNLKHIRNEILNFYPQGTGSDTALMAGYAAHTSGIYDESWLRPVAFVHDAIGYYIKKGNRDKLGPLVRMLEQVPQDVLETDIPFKIDVKVGDTWGTLEDLQIAS